MSLIIEARCDIAGGIVLSTRDQWLIQDVAESIVKTIGHTELDCLRIALAAFDSSNIESSFALDDARDAVAKGQVLKDSIILARLLPHEIVGLIAELQRALTAHMVAI